MKCREIIDELKKKWPEEYAQGWDNVGLLAGDGEQEVHHIFVALDVTDATLEQAIACKADMMITHHPLLLSPVKKVVADDFMGRRLIKLIRCGISYYAMHTNFDVTGMGNLNAASLELEFPSVLEVTHEDASGTRVGIGRVGMLHEPMTLEAFGSYVKEHLGLEHVRVYGEPQTVIKKAAIASGSGSDMAEAALRAEADVLVTGDVKYHTALDALAQGIAMVDGGHYGTEMIFIDYMEETLREMFPELLISSAKIQQPFMLI